MECVVIQNIIGDHLMLRENVSDIFLSQQRSLQIDRDGPHLLKIKQQKCMEDITKS